MADSNRLAVCLYGRFNNRYSEGAGSAGADYLRRNVLNREECDIYVFSTDTDHESEIISEWGQRAKTIVIQPPPDFDLILSQNGVDVSTFAPIESFRTAANTLSFLYNRAQCLNLLRQAISVERVAYRAALTCRFDVAQIDRYNGDQPFKVSEINFNIKRDMEFIYSAAWNQLNAGYADQWFYSSTKNLLILEGMYSAALEYLKDGSSYQLMLSRGIPDSNVDDPFSNEMLLPSHLKSAHLEIRDRSQAVDNHLLHKWYFIETGLYERSRFTSEIADVAHVLYTHSDYSDVWPAYFGQEEKYFSAFSVNYVLLDKWCSTVPTHYDQVLYDDNEPYVDRLISTLEKMSEEVIFFDHEDMIVTSTPPSELLASYSRLVGKASTGGKGSPKLDFVRLIRGGRGWGLPFFSARYLKRLHRLSPWIFSIQPTFWNRARLLDLLYMHRGQHIWEFEASAQQTCRNIGIKGAYVSRKGPKRGKLHWDNDVYPYIATAIVKGKWNTSEYGPELRPLFTEYEINPIVRGET